MSGPEAKTPDVTIRRRVKRGKHRGAYVQYATVYWRPLSVWMLGRWIIGGKRIDR